MPTARHDLVDWVEEAVRHHGGQATIIAVARYIWSLHDNDLRQAGDLFYTWQYEMRRAAQRLRDRGIFTEAAIAPRGIWTIRK